MTIKAITITKYGCSKGHQHASLKAAEDCEAGKVRMTYEQRRQHNVDEAYRKRMVQQGVRKDKYAEKVAERALEIQRHAEARGERPLLPKKFSEILNNEMICIGQDGKRCVWNAKNQLVEASEANVIEALRYNRTRAEWLREPGIGESALLDFHAWLSLQP